MKFAGERREVETKVWVVVKESRFLALGHSLRNDGSFDTGANQVMKVLDDIILRRMKLAESERDEFKFSRSPDELTAAETTALVAPKQFGELGKRRNRLTRHIIRKIERHCKTVSGVGTLHSLNDGKSISIFVKCKRIKNIMFYL
jgi:hypothetical protein